MSTLPVFSSSIWSDGGDDESDGKVTATEFNFLAHLVTAAFAAPCLRSLQLLACDLITQYEGGLTKTLHYLL